MARWRCSQQSAGDGQGAEPRFSRILRPLVHPLDLDRVPAVRVHRARRSARSHLLRGHRPVGCSAAWPVASLDAEVEKAANSGIGVAAMIVTSVLVVLINAPTSFAVFARGQWQRGSFVTKVSHALYRLGRGTTGARSTGDRDCIERRLLHAVLLLQGSGVRLTTKSGHPLRRIVKSLDCRRLSDRRDRERCRRHVASCGRTVVRILRFASAAWPRHAPPTSGLKTDVRARFTPVDAEPTWGTR